MGIRIHTNFPSLVAQNNIRGAKMALDSSYEKLSSGSRINSAGDDAAGLALSEGLKSQIRGLQQVMRNAQDGISVVQIGEGALSEVSNVLIRLREIAVQAASDTIGNEEREYLNIEFKHLTEEIDRIAESTEFNGVPLLNGGSQVYQVQIGLTNKNKIDRFGLFNPVDANINTISLGLNLSNVQDKEAAQYSLGEIDQASKRILNLRAEFGAIQNRLQTVVNNALNRQENLTKAKSRISDVDAAAESSEMTKNKILVDSGVSVLGQANASLKTALEILGGGR